MVKLAGSPLMVRSSLYVILQLKCLLCGEWLGCDFEMCLGTAVALDRSTFCDGLLGLRKYVKDEKPS